MSKVYDRDRIYEQVRTHAPCKESLAFIKSLPKYVTVDVLEDHPEGAEFAVRYAHSVIFERWLDAEYIIAANPVAAVAYATHVLKRRWPEAEEAILTDAAQSYAYARDVIQGPWPEAEPIITMDPKYWRFYEMEILNESRVDKESQD